MTTSTTPYSTGTTGTPVFEDSSISQITVFGDWHQNTSFALQQLLYSQGDGSDIFFHVGDFGLWKLNSKFIKAVEHRLSRIKKQLWFIDGNHENFNIINSLPRDEYGRGVVSDHILHIPRSFSWIWGDLKFLGLGGAVSVDKEFRQEGFDWFPEEQVTEDDVNKAVSAGHVDVLLTHDAPGLVWESPVSGVPDYLLKESELTRDRIKQVIAHTEPSLNVHGHHHKSYTSSFLGCKVVGLDCDHFAFTSQDTSVHLDRNKFIVPCDRNSFQEIVSG